MTDDAPGADAAFADQLTLVGRELPSLIAAAFARLDPADDRRWLLLDAIGTDGQESGSPKDGPLPETAALIALLRDTVRRGDPVAAAAAVVALELPRPWPDAVTATFSPVGPPADQVRGRVALMREACARPAPVRVMRAAATAEALAGDDVDGFMAALDSVRAARPWATNAVYTSIEAGLYTPDQIAIYVDQWRLHLAFGPALFAAVLGNLRPADPDHARLLKDVTATAGTAGGPNRRSYLAASLRDLRLALVGDRGEDVPAPLPETAAHLGLIGEISRQRSPAEAFAAVLALKPGFPDICARVAEALVGHYGLPEEAAAFFTHQRDRQDEGEPEKAAVRQAAAAGPDARAALVRAFRDGLFSYHLVLDGCHRAARELISAGR